MHNKFVGLMSNLAKEIKRVFMFYKEHLYILGFIVIVVLGMLAIQHFIDDIDVDFGLSLVPNFIADMIGILITSYIIAVLLQRSEEKKAKEKAFKITGNRYNGLVSILVSTYITLHTGKPYGASNEEQMKSQIKEILNDLHSYLPEDFIENKKIEIMNYKGNTRLIDYEQFCKQAQEDIDPTFEKFINRYIGFLPDDLRESLLNIETLLNSILITTSYDPPLLG